MILNQRQSKTGFPNTLRHESLQHAEFELTNKEMLCDLDWADDFVSLLGSTKHVQRALNGFATVVAPFDMCSATSKYKMLLQNSMSLVPKTILDGEKLSIVDRFTNLDTHLINDGSMVAEVNTRTSKARAEYPGLK